MLASLNEQKERKMALKVYVDRMSQPSRAILLLCKVNGIEFEEVKIQLAKSEHKSSEFTEINPMKQVPAIVHGDFKLFESHAILIYLASAFPGVAYHWYDVLLLSLNFLITSCTHKTYAFYYFLELKKLNDSTEGWPLGHILKQHFGIINGSWHAGYALNSTIILAFGQPINPKLAAEAENFLSSSLATIESFLLREDAPFLLGNSQPSIADLALVCEVMQIEVVDEEDRDRIVGPHKRILKWIEDVKNATEPYFDEFHSIMLPVKEKLKELKVQDSKLRPNYEEEESTKH